MKFINRLGEMARLNRLMKQEEGALVVIWGRRRIGKTRLLLEWVNKHDGIYYMADESSASLQRKFFSSSLEKIFPGFGQVEYPDWPSLLLRLAREAKLLQWKGPLVIDELPYLVAASPELPSLLQKFIDLEVKTGSLVLALCGSSQKMMQGAVLSASSPLYGRAQEIIKLEPISVSYLGEALDFKNPREIIESYAIWGGIPRYWELVKNNGLTLIDCIDHLVLDPMGSLNDEPQRLLLEEMPPATTVRPILDAIGLGAHRLSEIATKVGQSATSLSRPIQRLMEMDLIKKEIPFGCLEHHSKKTLYKIKDPFLRFWFETIAPKRSYLMQSHPSSRKKWIQEHLPPLYSIMWEDLCRRALPLLSESWGEPFFGQASRFWHAQGKEWDLVSSSLNGKAVLIGEAKWLMKQPSQSWTESAMEELKMKGFPPVDRHTSSVLYCALFLPEKPKKVNIPPHCRLVDAEEVLTALT